AARRLLPMTPVGMVKVQSARPVPVDSAVMEFIGSPRQAPEPTSSPKPKSAGPSEPSTTSGKSVPAGKSEPSPIHAALDTPVWARRIFQLLDVRSAGYLQAAEIFWGFSGLAILFAGSVFDMSSEQNGQAEAFFQFLDVGKSGRLTESEFTRHVSQMVQMWPEGQGA
ncbi:unnamed protein product, partial [Polarella glacialis]